jgi:hypothetical protein
MRPEEVEIAATRELLAQLLHATVEELLFTGAYGAPRLRLFDDPDAARLVGSADATQRIEATRSQPEQRTFPLQATRWCWALGACMCCPRRCPASLPAPTEDEANAIAANPLLMHWPRGWKRVAVHLLDDTAEQRAGRRWRPSPWPGRSALAASPLGRGANEVVLPPNAACQDRSAFTGWAMACATRRWR